MVWPLQLSLRYHQLDLLAEDLLTFCYLAFDSHTQKNVTVWIYKSEYITEALADHLLILCSQLSVIKQDSLLTLLDASYEEGYFCTVYEHFVGMVPLDVYLETHVLSVQDIWTLVSPVVSGLLKLESQHLWSGQLTMTGLYVTEGHKLKLTRSMIYMTVLKQYLDSFEVVEDLMFYPPETLHRSVYSIRSDVYAFGVLLFYLFSQKWPHPYTLNPAELKNTMLNEFDPFEPVFPDFPDKIRTLIYGSLSVFPEKRFQSFLDLAHVYQGKMELKEDYPVLEPFHASPPQDVPSSREVWGGRFKSGFFKGWWILVLIVVFFVGHFFFDRYMNALPDQAVPSVVGMTYEEAVKTLEGVSLKPVLVGERLSANYDKGIVLDTKPPAGYFVKKSRKIRLYVSSGLLSKPVPSLIGRPYSDVVADLQSKAFSVKVSGGEFSLTVPRGAVLNQFPAAHGKVSANEAIQVLLSNGLPVRFVCGSPKKTFFPDEGGLRRVDVTFLVLHRWKAQSIRLAFTAPQQSQETVIYSDLHQPGDEKSLSFELEVGGKLTVYFGSAQTSYIVGDPVEDVVLKSDAPVPPTSAPKPPTSFKSSTIF